MRTEFIHSVKRGERGVALLVVLGVAAVVGVMAAHLAVLSEVTAREAFVAAARDELKYAAESAAERALWLFLADRATYANRTLGQELIGREDPAAEVWMTDGKPHQLTVGNATVTVTLHDADSGLDFSGTAADGLRDLLRSDDVSQQIAVDRFLDVLADYVDADDQERLHGMERRDYEAEDYPDLPRNGPLQFREEAYWLKGLGDALTHVAGGTGSGVVKPTALRPIPPRGCSFSQSRAGRAGTGRAGLPSFFASHPTVLRLVGGLTDAELSLVLEARARWQATGEPLEQNLTPDILGRLRTRFSFLESGVAAVVASAATADGQVVRVLRLTRDCRPGGPAFADPEQKRLSYWEKTCE